MSVVPMQKINILASKAVEEPLVNELQKINAVEIRPLKHEPEKEALKSYEAELAEVRSAIEFLDKHSPRKKSFIESFVPFKTEVKQAVFQDIVREFDWQIVVKKLKEKELELSNAKNLENKLVQEFELLEPWEGIDAPLNFQVCLPSTCVVLGTYKSKDFKAFEEKIEKNSNAIYIEVIKADKNTTHLLILHLTSEEKPFSDFLAKTEFVKVALPISSRTPLQERLHILHLLDEVHEQIKERLKDIKQLQKHHYKLACIHDHLLQKNLEKEARGKFLKTEYTFILSGWIKASDFDKIKEKLNHLTPEVEIFKITPEKDEKPPIAIENIKILGPFELITKIFGLPRYFEIDPTAPLSFFFLLFFAICLSDVGYGISLALISYYLLKKYRFPEGGKNLLTLLMWGGILTIGAGIFTGSYFGLNVESLPYFLKNTLGPLRIIDPIKNPLTVLLFSLALGVIQLMYGLALAMYWKIKYKEYAAAILDCGLWIFFLSSLVMLAVTSGMGHTLAYLASRLSIIGALLLILTQGRKEKGIIKKAIVGLLSLYRTTSYLGDILSYSRLLALMMTTSIIGMVVNLIANLSRGSIPVLGYIIMLGILVIGHIFNLVISTLGAFIHSTRLQLVEFFGKFFEGGGREFRPFRRETKYLIIT